MSNRRRKSTPPDPPTSPRRGPEYIGSFHLFTRGLQLGLRIDRIPQEPRIACPVCGAKLERVAGAGAICASCGYAESAPGNAEHA